MDKPVQRRAGVFYSLTGVVLIVGVAAVLLSAGLTVWLTHLLTQQWVWDYRPPVSATDPEFGFPGAARTSLLVVAGLGGVVALVVAFRRQRHLEQDHAGQRDQIRLFTERFGAAAEQLGSAAAATRLAGVYAMAALADEWVDQRQQCVDVLCAYLRLPYRPVGESDGALRRTLTTTREGSNWRAEVADVQEFRHGERQVRLTVISVIREHLQVDRPEANWSFLDFDFSGATFDGGDFSGSYFWRKVSFGGSTFLPGNVSFTSTHFLSDRTDFTGCDFAGATVYFGGAEFVGQSVDFAGAEFSAGQVQFNGTNFASNSVNFAGAHFSGAEVTSDGATFRQGVVAFDGASFSAGSFNVTRAEFTGSEVTFRGSLFVGCGVRFDSSEFRCQRLNFDRALFSSGTVVFEASYFDAEHVDMFTCIMTGGSLRFQNSMFAGGAVRFRWFKIRGGELSFAQSHFRGGTVDFGGCDIDGGTVDLRVADYTPGSLDFRTNRIVNGVVELPEGVTMDDLRSDRGTP